jgi:uncharacterized protein
MAPTLANGKICYLELPAVDVEAACRAVEKHGGSIVQPVGAERPEITARLRDPGGNIIGLYQQPDGAAR